MTVIKIERHETDRENNKEKCTTYEYGLVPRNVAKAVKTILDSMDGDTKVVSSVNEVEEELPPIMSYKDIRKRLKESEEKAKNDN